MKYHISMSIDIDFDSPIQLRYDNDTPFTKEQEDFLTTLILGKIDQLPNIRVTDKASLVYITDEYYDKAFEERVEKGLV